MYVYNSKRNHSTVHVYARIGMKVEGKVSNFSAEKWTWNENMEMEIEFYKMEAEVELFWRKWK
jgi:hypothetical protein